MNITTGCLKAAESILDFMKEGIDVYSKLDSRAQLAIKITYAVFSIFAGMALGVICSTVIGASLIAGAAIGLAAGVILGALLVGAFNVVIFVKNYFKDQAYGDGGRAGDMHRDL